MVESDQGEISNQKDMASSGVSDDTIEVKHKRQRVESSEDESLEVSTKKRRISENETVVQNHDLELNGETVKMEENTDDVTIKHEHNDESLSENDDKDKNNKPESSNQNEDSNTSIKAEPLDDPAELTIKNESISIEDLVEEKDENKDNKPESPKEAKNDHKEKDENENSNKILRKSETSSGLEVVEGLELSVECASEKDSSSSENEEEKPRVPKTKTTIVKAKPTDSELEIGSSEADMSDQQDELVTNNIKETKGKRGRKKVSKKPLAQEKNSDSEDSINSKSDEEYSPKTKNKLKKNVNKKSSESKRGRGRGRRKTPKPDDSTNEAENSKKEQGEPDDKSGSISDHDDSENESQSKVKGSKKDTSLKSPDERKLDRLKKYIRAAGIHVKSYNDLFAQCNSHAEKIDCLKDLLEKNGVTGRPSVEKCKKAKIRNETLRDISELNTGNIISEVRITRSQRNLGQNKELKNPSGTPPKQREARSSFKRIMSVVDSDSE